MFFTSTCYFGRVTEYNNIIHDSCGILESKICFIEFTLEGISSKVRAYGYVLEFELTSWGLEGGQRREFLIQFIMEITCYQIKDGKYLASLGSSMTSFRVL